MEILHDIAECLNTDVRIFLNPNENAIASEPSFPMENIYKGERLTDLRFKKEMENEMKPE